ncbi:low affinity iron permease family protein [Ensifer sp. IC3342]|nr:low affinity iron permease family protein [Ensifer sp. BRP08]MCA1450894.1 low affinity iron permease family protein [Ensifer sp. IC3342]
MQGVAQAPAIQAKLDEIIVSTRETRNEVVGIEHEQTEHIAATVERLEEEANGQSRSVENGKSMHGVD